VKFTISWVSICERFFSRRKVHQDAVCVTLRRAGDVQVVKREFGNFLFPTSLSVDDRDIRWLGMVKQITCRPFSQPSGRRAQIAEKGH
jgi:hypothetical protein